MQATGRCSGYRNREASCRSFRTKSGQAADGASAKRVLPEREDQSDSARARQKGRKVRDRRASTQNRDGRHAERRARKGNAGTEAAGDDAANVGGIDGLAKLPGLADRHAVEKEITRNPQYRNRRKGSE